MSEAPLSDKEFERLLVEMIGFLKAFARGKMRMKPEDAEDLVQDALYLAWRSRRQFQPGSNFKSWMFTILCNRQWSIARRWKVLTIYPLGETDQGTEFDVPISGGQEETIELSDTLKAMSELPLEQLDSLMLITRGHGYDDVAAEQGVAAGTVKSRVARARAKLREKCR
jgi:RNA polymerase sigma-70 factor (ECF subfamily)